MSPGKVSDYYTTIDKSYEIQEASPEPAGNELKRLMKLRNTKIGNLSNDWNKRCHKCEPLDENEEFEDKPVKPLRFHHCSLCDS